uniref:WW domain-containing protein n=1 Tax=Mesocestoides corti TaxID=53468 RepID=A0A5K3F4U3_MESCO
MTDMFEYLDSVSQANNSQSAAIEAQLQESVEALRDMERMQPTLSNMDNAVDQLQKFFAQPYIESIKGRLAELKQTWNRIKDLTNENISFLRRKLETALALEETGSLERTPDDQRSLSVESSGCSVQEAPITVTGDERLLQQALPRKESDDIEANVITVKMLDMNELQRWISKAKHRLSKYNAINSADELEAFANFLEEFGKELHSKRSMIAAIRSGQVTDATGKPVTERTALLFSGHFADLESEYAAGQERLKSATYHLNDFNSLMSYEKHWLDRVETTIRRSKQHHYTDIDYICEDITAFENLKSEHTDDDFARLQQIVELLSSESTMAQKLSSEFESYAANVSSALQRLNERLEELKILKKRTEDTHARLAEYEKWLRETEAIVQKRLRDGENASSNPEEFSSWCANVTNMEEMVSTINPTLEMGTNNLPGNAVEPNSLGERAATIKAELANFKRILLQFTYPTDVQDSIACCREATRENDVSAINLEVVSLASEHVSGLVKKSQDLCNRIQDTQNLLSGLQSTVSSMQIRPELSACNEDLLMELNDLYSKNTKLYEHVKRFERDVQKLQPFADQYSAIIDPLEQVMMNVEEVTDYLETADTQVSHIDMLQQVHSELSEVLGPEQKDAVLPTADGSVSDVKKPPLQQLEELLTKLESEATPVDGLSSTIADVRRVINKAFAARTAFRAQIDGIKTASSESSITENTEIPLPSKHPVEIQGVQVASVEGQEIGPQEETNNHNLSTLYTRSNQLIAEMGSFFEDLASFNKYCVKLDQPPKSATAAAQSEPLQTSITACSKKIEIYLNFYEHYFKQQSQYLESRLNDLVKAANVLPIESRNMVQKVQKLWANSRGHLSWQNEQINQLSKTLKDAEEAFTKYERLPTDKNRKTCLTYITQLEGTYNWSLTQDRARLDDDKHGEIARQLTSALQQTCILRKLLPFRECLQQFVTQLNEIQDELHSCQSIPTHELSSQIQSLDQYFILAQEAASKATNILNRCKAGHTPVVITDDGNESGNNGDELLGNLLWLEAVLETQKGRLNSYCNEFHLCRPYWQEYALLWQSFMNEAIRQKHQIAMLHLDRRPSEDQGNTETSEGSARDYAVNICSSVLTLQRLGSKLVWKAQRGEVGQGLDSDLYLQPVFDKRCSRRPLRNEVTLQNDVTFVNETFDAIVGDLRTLSKKYAIEGFLPPNLRIDATSLESHTSGKADSSGDTDGVLETTFPQNQSLGRSEDLGVTNVEACLNRLKEELIWLEENQLYVPVVETPTNYISKLDGEFWLPPGAAGPLRLCSKWAKRKAQDLSKLDGALKTHERRSGQLCTISEKLSADLEDSETRRRLHEAADELHACMESARGIINRRRTRLASWLSTCLTFEAAMLMDSDGEEVDKGGEQTLPVWISTIRKRLQMSSPNLDSPMFQKELEQLRGEFDPAGSGTGQTLRAVELAFETQLSDAQSPPQNYQYGVFPQLDPGVVDSIQICLSEWKTVCRLLRIGENNMDLSQSSDQRQQQTSPMTHEAGLDASVRKLASWLDTVIAYLSSNVACLGGKFNQEAVIAHIKNRSGDQKSYTVRSLYPEVIQIQLQQYAIELDARKPQLDKLQIEAGRLTEGSRNRDVSPSQLVSMVEEVRQSWNSTSAQVKARLDELEKMLIATDELKSAEKDLDRWLSRAEADLANALSNTQEAAERKRLIQEIIDRLPAGETKFMTHQNKCEAILSKYSKEDTQKFRSDQEAIRSRWSQLVSRLRESLECTSQPDSDFIEIPISTHPRSPETDLQRITRLRSVSTQQAGSYRSTEHFLPPEPRSMEASMIETSYNVGSPGQGYSSSTLGRHHLDQKPPFLNEAYRGNQLSRSVDIRVRPCDSRPVMRMPLENWPLFLAQLRQMNDWLAHQDAAFHQLRGTVGGDSETVSQLINSFSVLEEELQQQRFQVEELLDRGHVFLKDQFVDARLGSFVESEGDSDGSELDLVNVDFDESSMSTKRIIRRIKRHLNYLDKHWAELNGSMLTYRQQLDRAFQKLTVFERVLDDAERELASTQKLLMSRDLSGSTDDQALQVIWDTCASVTHAIAGLDGQALRLSDDGTIISHVLISRLDGLKIGLERLRSETNDEMNRSPTRNGEAGVVPVSQRPLRSPPQHLLEGDRPASVASTAGSGAPIPRPKSPSECWLQAFKTIPYPWERCLLPSGNQVPYYKNHATQETQWDHPIMVDLLQRLDESNAIRFPAYRTAIKIRQIQHTLFFDQIPLNVATETFARHGLSSPLCSEGCDGRVMDVPQIVNCLTTLYCRVWDTLVSQPDVVKVTDPEVSGTKAGTLPQNANLACKTCTSESTLSAAGRLASTNESYSTSENRPKTRRTPTHRSAIKCMTSVLCVSGSKHSRGRDDDEENLDAENGGPRRPVTLSGPQPDESGSPGSLIPAESHVPTSFSRVDKLQTILKLPDGREFSLPTCVDLALNLLLNSFDSSTPITSGDVIDNARNGSVRVLSFKVTIFLLINASLEEKYQYLFSLVADRDNKINNSRLWLLIYETMQLPRQLGEVQASNNNLDPNILMCFAKNLKVGGHESRPNGVTRTPTMESQRSVTWPPNEGDSLPSVGLDRFYEWLKLEPPMIAWVPALHRLVAGEKLTHQVRCAVCQTYPMKGLRYRCLRCLNFDICQNCFLVGRVEKSHKVTHPTQEYTATLQRSDSLRDFTRVVRNRFKSKEKFRQSSFDTEDASKSITVSRPTGLATPTLHDRPPRSTAFRQNSTAAQHPSRAFSAWQNNRPASLGDTRKRVLATGGVSSGDNSLPRLAGKPPRGASIDQEHELIAQYSQSLRRQNSFTSTGMPMPGCQQPSYLGPREPHYPMAGQWQYPGGVYDRSRAPEPRFFTMRPNQYRGGGGFRAASQPPPPHGGSSAFVSGPPINSHANWYRNSNGWTGPVVAGSAGSLDKVLMNLEEENRFLRAEYDWLRLHSSGQNLRPMRSPSLQYPLSLPGAYPEADRYHSPAYYGNPYFPGYPPMNPPQGSQTERIYPSSNGILYGGSLGRASGPTAHAAFLRSSGGGSGSCRLGFEQGNQRYQLPTAKPTPMPTNQQPAHPTMQEGELAQEARLLRQHKTRLESRMQLLEDHNKALEDQLNRLRRYLNIPASASANPISVTASPNAPSQSFDQTCTQSYARTNGTADQQSGNDYLGTQYIPISDELPPTSSYATPVDPPAFNQGQGRSGSLTGASP